MPTIKRTRAQWNAIHQRDQGEPITEEEYFAQNKKHLQFMELTCKPIEIAPITLFTQRPSAQDENKDLGE